MKITDFNKMITEYEGKKKNIDIAQVSEIVRIANLLTEGTFYSSIKKMDESLAKSILKNSAKTVAKKVAPKKTSKSNAGKSKKA